MNTEIAPALELKTSTEIRFSDADHSIDALLSRRRHPLSRGNPLAFAVEPGIDVYNTSVWFPYQNKAFIIGREERQGELFSSKLVFFYRDSATNVWRPDYTVSNLSQLTSKRIIEDPAIAYVQGEYVVTCVEVDPASANDPTKGSVYRTAVYCGETLDKLGLLTKSPDLMKGVRLVELRNGQVGTFTRPQSPGNSERGGLGKIGFTIVDRLEDLDAGVLGSADLIKGLFSEKEWGGVNDVQLLPDGRLAVLAHTARFTPGGSGDSREYYPLFFIFDPFSRTAEDRQITATMSDYASGLGFVSLPPKTKDLENVCYPGWLSFPDGLEAKAAVQGSSIKDRMEFWNWIPNPLLSTFPIWQ